MYENFPDIYLTNSTVLHLIYDNLHSHRGTINERTANTTYIRVSQGFVRCETEFRFIILFVTKTNPHFSISSDQQTSRSFSAGDYGFEIVVRTHYVYYVYGLRVSVNANT